MASRKPKTRNVVELLCNEGIDWSVSEESIGKNSLRQANNRRYDYSTGGLRTVHGKEVLYEDADGNVVSGFYDKVNDVHIFSVDDATNKLKLTDFTTTTDIGTLTGAEVPVYDNYGQYVLIASGGKLQKLDNTTLTTIAASPNASFVTYREGRVLVFSINDDNIDVSTVQDEEDWTNVGSDPSSAQSEPIDPKSPGKIIAVDAGTDLKVYKEGGAVYRVMGDFGDANTFAIKEINRDSDCLNKFCALSVNGRAFFLGRGGFKAILPSDKYGDYEPFEEGRNVNAYLIQNMDTSAKMFYVPPLREVWIKTQNDKRIYCYNTIPFFEDGRGRFTTFDLQYDLNAVWCKDDEVYIAYGNKIARLTYEVATDAAIDIQTSTQTKRFLPVNKFTRIKRRKFYAKNIVPGSGTFAVGNKTEPYLITTSDQEIFSREDDIFDATDEIAADDFIEINKSGGGNARSYQVTVVTSSGADEIRSIMLHTQEV
jgi:hypothetical protein